MLGRAVIAALIGALSGAVMLYALTMGGRYLLSCTLDTATKSFTCGPHGLEQYKLILGVVALCWAASIPGHAAFGIGGVKPPWAAQLLAMATAALSFAILFKGFDIVTTLRLGDRNVLAFLLVWLILPPALGLVVAGLAVENDDEPEPYTGLETYSPPTSR